MSQKRFPEEFKIEAVKQITQRGHSVSGNSFTDAFITLYGFSFVQCARSARSNS